MMSAYGLAPPLLLHVVVAAAGQVHFLNGAGVDVFVHGMRAANTNVTYPCIRIPSVISTGEGTVVAFMECRFSCADECWPKALEGTCWKGDGRPRLGGAGSPLGGDVCMKRSTNFGRSWGELLVVGPGGRSPSGLWDPLEKTITLAYSQYHSLDMYLRTSSDGGASWAPPRSIDGAAGIANHSGFQPGTGITLVGGPHAGRKPVGAGGRGEGAGRLGRAAAGASLGRWPALLPERQHPGLRRAGRLCRRCGGPPRAALPLGIFDG